MVTKNDDHGTSDAWEADTTSNSPALDATAGKGTILNFKERLSRILTQRPRIATSFLRERKA